MAATVVVQVDPHGDTRRYFVASASTPGVFWHVRFVPGKSLTCSCPHGQRIVAAGVRLPSPRPCRHLRSVVELEQERVA